MVPHIYLNGITQGGPSISTLIMWRKAPKSHAAGVFFEEPLAPPHNKRYLYSLTQSQSVLLTLIFPTFTILTNMQMRDHLINLPFIP